MTGFIPVDVPLFDREALWRAQDGRWMESLRMVRDGQGWMASGVMIGMTQRPYRLIYQISVDRYWRPRQVSVDHPWGEPEALRFLGDGDGGWTTALGDTTHDVSGCLDLQIGPGAFGLVAAVRRLAASGETVYAGSAMRLSPFSEQATAVSFRLSAKTPLGEGEDGGGVYMVAAGGDAEIEIIVDRDGFPMAWPKRYDLIYADEQRVDDEALIVDENPPIGTMMG